MTSQYPHCKPHLNLIQLSIQIRAREAAKTAREMTRSSGENKELEMLSRLPEMARIIRNIFITEKKAALSWEIVATKVAASFTSMLAGSKCSYTCTQFYS